MNDLIYAGVVIVGAITLLIEAFRNFNLHSGHHPFELHPILKDIEVRNLCTPSEAVTGFAFYAFSYLAIYGVILGSAEVYELIASAKLVKSEIGAAGDVLLPQSDPLGLSSTAYGKPIFVSAFMISFLSIGAVKPIEATLRNLAHRLAGIPRGVYKVIESLRDIPYEEYVKGYPTPLAQKFREKMKGLDPDNEFKFLRNEIESALIAIDCLSPATSASNRTLYFPLYSMATLTDLSNSLEEELSALNDAITGLGISPEDTESENSDGPAIAPDTASLLSDLSRRVSVARSNTMAVFAVLFVRNNRSVFSNGRKSYRKLKKQSGRTSSASVSRREAVGSDPIEATKWFIEQRYNAEQNSFAIALFFAALFSVFTSFVLLNSWLTWNTEKDTPPQTYVEILDAELKGHNERSSVIQCEKTDDGIAPKPISKSEEGNSTEKNRSQTQIAKDARDACDKILSSAQSAYLENHRDTVKYNSLWVMLRTAALVFASVFFVLIGREIRIEQQSWNTNWRFTQFPFLRLFGMSFFSGILGVFAAACIGLAEYAFESGFQLTQTQVISHFEQWGGYYGFQFGAGIILAISALIIMDKHDTLSAFWTLIISTLCALACAGYIWIAIFFTYAEKLPERASNFPFSQHIRETITEAALPFFFLILFAFILELTERGVKKSSFPKFSKGQAENANA